MNSNKQQGATLFVALVFLLIMTLFAVSSINMSTVNLKVIGNMQAMKQMDAAIQDAIEQMLSDSSHYNTTPTASSITTTILTASATTVQAVVEIEAPACIDSQTATGYSAVVENIIPEDNTWEVIATVSDPVTGATSTIHQGMAMRMLAGNCPTP